MNKTVVFSETEQPEVNFQMLQRAGDYLQYACNKIAEDAGWHTDLDTGLPRTCDVPRGLMLIVSEIAEAMEGHRKDLMDTHLTHRKMLEVELADAVIRIANMCGHLGLDLGGAIAQKCLYNMTREDHKPENRKKADGKKY